MPSFSLCQQGLGTSFQHCRNPVWRSIPITRTPMHILFLAPICGECGCPAPRSRGFCMRFGADETGILLSGIHRLSGFHVVIHDVGAARQIPSHYYSSTVDCPACPCLCRPQQCPPLCFPQQPPPRSVESRCRILLNGARLSVHLIHQFQHDSPSFEFSAVKCESFLVVSNNQPQSELYKIPHRLSRNGQP